MHVFLLSTFRSNLNIDLFQEMIIGDKIHEIETKSETSSPALCKNLGNIAASSSSESAFNSSRDTKGSSNQKRLSKTLIHSISQKESSDMDIALENFFFGCRIPHTVIDSVHFRNFVKTLCPSYVASIPSQETFSTSVVDAAYERSLRQARKHVVGESVLLVDGGKGSNCVVVTSIRDDNGNKFFLNAWDIRKTLEQIVNESVEIAKQLYDTAIFAVVADFTSVSEQTCEAITLWRSCCSCRVANMLAQDIVDEKVSEHVRSILKFFHLSDYRDTIIIDAEGSLKMLPAGNDWSSHHRSLKCFLENIDYMRQVASESSEQEQDDFKTFINDAENVASVEDMVTVLDALWEIVSISQDSDCTLADVVHRWLSLTLPERSFRCIVSLEKCRSMAVNVYALAAYYLHPKYHDSASVTLSQEQRSVLNHFFVEELANDGLTSLCSFENKKGVFGALFLKENLPAMVFWRRVFMEHESLAKFALKVLKIPASTAQLEDCCSESSFIQNGLPAGSEKKLMYLYYNLYLADAV